MTSFAVAFLISLVVAAAMTPLVLRVALARELYDLPDERKVHERPIPRLGGIAIVLAFFAPVTGLLLVNAGASAAFKVESHVIGLYVGGLLIAAVGIYDDLKGANAIQKLVVQLSVAGLMFALDYRIEFISNPFGAGVLDLGSFALPVTILWFVGVINAVNLIDGLDGLAGGIGFISISVLFALALMDGNTLAALLCASLAGALLGFLFFNFNPARIFMGDTGSLFLGFVLAAFSISTSSKGSTTVALLVPMLALGLPIIDTFLAIGRRWRHQRPIFSADQDHIHHKLLRAGFSHRQAVLSLYVVAVFLAGAALLLKITSNLASGLVLFSVAVILFMLFRLVSRGTPEIRGLVDPMTSHEGLDRAVMAELCVELGQAASAEAIAVPLIRLAELTDVLAVTILREGEPLFVWNRSFGTKEVIKGMSLYTIPLVAPEAKGAGLHVQFVDRGLRQDLGTIVPWEVASVWLARALNDHGWAPVQIEIAARPSGLRAFLAIPGVGFADVDPLSGSL